MQSTFWMHSQRPDTTGSQPPPHVSEDGHPIAGLWHAKPVPPSRLLQGYRSKFAGQHSLTDGAPALPTSPGPGSPACSVQPAIQLVNRMQIDALPILNSDIRPFSM